MATPLDDLSRLSQYLSDISGDLLVTNYEQMTIRGGRKMTFAIQHPDAKEIVIRFTPDFFAQDARPPSPQATLRQRANSDLTEAFKEGKALLEVVNIDNKRTAYISKKTHKTLLDKVFHHKKKDGKEHKYSEVKEISQEQFEKMVQRFVAHKASADDTIPQVTKELLVESTKDLPPATATQISITQLAVKSESKNAARHAPSIKSKKRKSVEESEFEEGEKKIAQERDQLHAKRSKKEHQERIDKTVEAQERRKEEEMR